MCVHPYLIKLQYRANEVKVCLVLAAQFNRDWVGYIHQQPRQGQGEKKTTTKAASSHCGVLHGLYVLWFFRTTDSLSFTQNQSQSIHPHNPKN
jgi:hypothetical protein